MRAIASLPEYDIPDAELVRRFQEGQEHAFDQVVFRHQDRIYALACRLVQDSDEAADIVQETFIKVYGELKRFRGDSALYTWLYRIVLNLSINRMRKKKIRSFVSLDDQRVERLESQGGPERDLELSESRRQVDAAIASLPARQRSIFVLRHFEQLSHREIAEALGSSEGAVRAGYFQAVKKLQSALRDLL